jgi:hypothetical protein
MKWLMYSSLLSVALAVGDARAQTQVQRGGIQIQQPPQQAAPSQTAPVPRPQQPAVVGRPPQRPVRESPAVVRTQPAIRPRSPGAVDRPSGTLNQPVRTPRPPAQLPSGQNFVGGSREFQRFPTGGNFHWGDRSGTFHRGGHTGDFHPGDFHHRGHRSNFVIVYINGVAWWYPFYTAYPYYYDAPLAPTYDSSYYGSGASSVPYVDEGAGGGAVSPSYADLGQQWGQDLRREVATWDDFVDYVRTYIIVAPPEAQAEFREAFVASYGINGAAAYDKAAQQAAQTSSTQGPKVITVPSSY